VIIECSHCGSKYQYDVARFDGKAGKRIRCAKCQQIFEIHNPAAAAPPAAASSEGEFDQTRTARPRTLADVPKPTTQEQPRTTGQQDVAPRLPDGYRLSLAVISGPDAGSVHRLDKPRTTIGRAADVSINDNESSRHHAALEIREHLYLLEDLGSTNGTLIDGEKISGQVELHNHSEFQIGASTLMLIVTEEL
jgi:predicted Zn finger-like uncharacterized protein